MCLAATDYHLGNIENVAPCSLRPGFIDRIYRFSSGFYRLFIGFFVFVILVDFDEESGESRQSHHQ